MLCLKDSIWHEQSQQQPQHKQWQGQHVQWHIKFVEQFDVDGNIFEESFDVWFIS